MGYGGGDPSTDAAFGSPVNTVTGGIDKSKPVSKTKKGIGYSATDNTLLLDITKTTTEGSVQSSDIRALNIKNAGKIPTFIMLAYQHWTDATTQDGNTHHVHYLIKPGEELFMPTIRGIISDEDIAPYAGTAVADGVPDANMYTDSTADLDNTTATDNIVGDNDDTTAYVETYTSAANCNANFFRVGDLIRVTNEIMEVTALGDKSDLANSTLTVKRGVYGSTAVDSHADDADIRLPFFNAYHDFDKYSVAQTDSQGRFKCFNMFGVGRAATALQGIVPGSFSVQFYEAGYQELGLSGITSSTNSGLTAGETLKLDITVDGGSLFQDLTFTLDSSNVNFGGKNGVVAKIQAALDVQYYTAGNLFEKKVHVGIVDGDIRFTSGSHLATSAILLADTGDSDTFIDAAANGRIPASGSIDAAVAAKLATTTKYDPVTYATSFKQALFVYDDGNGNLFGKARGTINYETGAIDMVGCPPNAQFVYSVLHTSAFSGKQDATESTKMNSLQAVYANIPSQKWAGEIEIETF